MLEIRLLAYFLICYSWSVCVCGGVWEFARVLGEQLQVGKFVKANEDWGRA
jgi:hypothetical protein